MEFRTFKITKDDSDRRVDRVARRFLPKMSLVGIYTLLRKGLIRVDGKKVSPDSHVSEGSFLGIAYNLIDSVRTEEVPVSVDFTPEIILATEDLLFINKPAGIPVHGVGGLDRLIAQSISSSQSLSFKTGPLHRLDKDTTGLLAFSRSLEGARWFSESVSNHIFKKYYLGLAEGFFDSESEWHDVTDDDKEMITIAKPIATSRDTIVPLTLVLYRIITGRKHQIRIQTSRHGHPLVGDTRYKSKLRPPPYYLHAWQLLFPPDRLTNIPEKLIAPLSGNFHEILLKSFDKDVLAHIGQGDLYWTEHEKHH